MGRFAKLERGGLPPKEKQKVVKKPAVEVEEPLYDAPYYIHQGDEYFFYGDFRNALRSYSRAIQQDSSNVYPWIAQVLCLLEQKQLRESEIWAMRAVEQFPEHVDALAIRAMTYAYKGMTKRALGSIDFALQRGSTPFAWIARGVILLLADNKNAHFCFDKALEYAPQSDWKFPMLVGLYYFKQKAYSSALKFFKRAAANNVENYYLWYHIGRCFQFLGFAQKALEAYTQAQNLNPNFRPLQIAIRQVTQSFFPFRVMRRVVQLIKRR